MPTLRGEPEWLKKALDEAEREGRILKQTGVRSPAGPAPKKMRDKVRYAVPSFQPDGEACGWVVPLKLDSSANSKSFMRSHMGIAGRHRRAVAQELARYLSRLVPHAKRAQAGKPVYCRIDRLGGGRMDDDNLGIVCKWVRDTVALFLGVGDGPGGPVKWSYGQEPGPEYGVRITLSRSPL